MNRISMVARWLVALIALAIPLSGFAAPPEKLFVLKADATVATGSNSTMKVQFKNVSPDGNSTWGSLRLSVTGFTINTVTVDAPFTGQPGTPTLSGGVSSVVIQNINRPVKPGDILTLTVNVNAPCGVTANWFPSAPGTTVHTGSSLNGQQFATNPGDLSFARNYFTQASTAASLVFKTQPQDAYAGAIITNTDFNAPPSTDGIQVQLVQCNTPSTALNGQSVTIASSGGTLAGTTSATIAGSIAKFTDLLITPAAATYNLVASTAAFGSVPALSVTSASFEIKAVDGDLACGETAPNGDILNLKRELYNKDGVTGPQCKEVVYDVTRFVFQGKQAVEVKWDTALQPLAVLSYTIPWALEAVDPDTGMPVSHKTWVAWQYDPAGAPIFRFAVACHSSNPPAPFGKLLAPLNNTDVTSNVVIDSTGFTAPPATPGFPIIVGTERMQVTSVTNDGGGQYTLGVTRATGLTTKAAHAVNDLAMSTPLPIDNNTALPLGGVKVAGDQAMMCIFGEGWGSVGGQILYLTSLFDIGDGVIVRDE